MEAAALEYAMLTQQQQQSLSRQMPQQSSVIYPRPTIDNMAEQHDANKPSHSQTNPQQAQQPGQQFVPNSAPQPSSSTQTSSGIAAPMPDPQKPTFFSANGSQAPISCDIKPRLTKEQHDILESHFQKQNKPNTSTKKGFAETLNVSLDKVNNWFQNRRAKSKQDAKKLANTQTTGANSHDQPLEHPQLQQSDLLHDVDIRQQEQQQQQQQIDGLMHNDGSSVPGAFSDVDYYTMMQSCGNEDAALTHQVDDPVLAPNAFASQINAYPPLTSENTMEMAQINNFLMLAQTQPQPQQQQQRQQPQHDMFDSPEERNRRTLTQEHFDALEQHHSMPSDYIRDLFPMANNIPGAVPSRDTTITSSISDGSTYRSSDWIDSRSSSISAMPDEHYAHVSASQSSDALSSANGIWPSAHSSLVDLHNLDQEFQQMQHVPQQIGQDQHRLLTWPSEHNLSREAQALSLAQQMSHVELQTPQLPQNAQFKSPPPPSSIAARRQRPRPAALGIASLRSQSYSGAGQPASPGANTQSAAGPSHAQTLRRIRSSNVITGLPQGRIQKGVPGAAQRSPLAWNFPDSLSSPKALRHQSSGNLAPPTPMSPKEFVWQPPHQANRPGSHWQNAGRQPSISESDAEYLPSSTPLTAVLDQNVSSPPHTPMYPANPFLQYLNNGATVENTPPQSAPATQTSFFNTYPPNPMAMPTQAQMNAQNFRGHTQAFSEMQQQFMNAAVSEHPSMHEATLFSQQNPPSSISDDASLLQMQYANNILQMNDQSRSTLAYPPGVQYFQQQDPTQPQPPPQTFAAFPELHGYEPQQAHLHLSSCSPVSQPEKMSSGPSDFFVHQYNPPADTSVRVHDTKKYSDTGPKSYTFANQGPEHFEKSKKAIDAKGMQTGSTSASTVSSESAHDYQSA